MTLSVQPPSLPSSSRSRLASPVAPAAPANATNSDAAPQVVDGDNELVEAVGTSQHIVIEETAAAGSANTSAAASGGRRIAANSKKSKGKGRATEGATVAPRRTTRNTSA